MIVIGYFPDGCITSLSGVRWFVPRGKKGIYLWSSLWELVNNRSVWLVFFAVIVEVCGA